MAFMYDTIAQDSNWIPIALFVRSEGEPLDPLGVTVTVTVKNRDTKAYIVQDAVATPVEGTVGRWEYLFSPEQVHDIDAVGTWQVEWVVSIQGYKWRLAEPATLVVRKKL